MMNRLPKLTFKHLILLIILFILPNAIIAWDMKETWEDVKTGVKEGSQKIQEGVKKGTEKAEESAKYLMEKKVPEWKQDLADGVEQSRQKLREINEKIQAILPEFDTSGQGCGSGLTTQIVTDNWGMFDFTKACEQHDACYEQCNVTQKSCDDAFFTNLLKACPAKEEQWAKYEVCKELAIVYWFSVSKAGHSAFEKSQDSACQDK
jgi:hypothetical protein